MKDKFFLYESIIKSTEFYQRLLDAISETDIEKYLTKEEDDVTSINEISKNTILYGPPGTGKTSFVNKWIKNTFDENYKATIVSEFSYKIVDYKDKSYKIQLWDLAGMDQNICITKDQGCHVH